MSEPFMSEIKIMSFGFPPKGWALCNGQLLPINQNQALFSLLGTTYGGDGRVNFGLPDLQGRRFWGQTLTSEHSRLERSSSIPLFAGTYRGRLRRQRPSSERSGAP
jgi:microcystin-dependent protein